jgi:hypothetical protein
VDWSGTTDPGGFADAKLTFEGNLLERGNGRRQDTGGDAGQASGSTLTTRCSKTTNARSTTEGCYQIGLSPSLDSAAPVTRILSKTPLLGLKTSITRSEHGYFASLQISLTTANFPAGKMRAGEMRAGRPLKLSVLLDDKDDPKAGHRKNVFDWSFSPSGANYADTSG